jgi:hypothetical protein
MLSVFSGRRIDELLSINQRLAVHLNALQDDLLLRLQRVENELIALKLGRLFAELHVAIELAVRQGTQNAEAFEKGLRAIVAPLPRGKAGGLARARTAWRYSDGTFMAEVEKWEAYREEYDRYASGGRKRAATALRASDGTFLPTIKLSHRPAGAAY